ncbi:uncharacterized protein Dyak_GE28516, isoform A [Drosophila yakuba]|uniref:Uncharacterized protein, isoform A n=1 Tax=Drosophila yakuba TaxID=7245 RepID=A0A0R1EC18_DROYA|nr:uncharacterized protein Dyak_GE28516, isoform A [Drosophila yakuba]
MPENRRYGLVITNQSSDAEGVDTVALIVNANRRRCNAALFFLLMTGISSGAAVCHHRLHTSTLANIVHTWYIHNTVGLTEYLSADVRLQHASGLRG